MKSVLRWEQAVAMAFKNALNQKIVYRPVDSKAIPAARQNNGRFCELVSVITSTSADSGLHDETVLPVYVLKPADGGAQFYAVAEELGDASVEVRKLLTVVASGFAAARDLGFDGPKHMGLDKGQEAQLDKRFGEKQEAMAVAGVPYNIDIRTDRIATVMMGDVVGYDYSDITKVPEWGWATLNATYLHNGDDTHDVLIDLRNEFVGEMGRLSPLVNSLKSAGVAFLQLQHV